MSRRRAASAERGFTLIEMIVVLVVLGMAMAAIFPAIGNMMRSGSRSAALSQAGSEAAIAARQFEYDVRRALGARGTGERTDFTTTSTMATIPALNYGAANVVDIVEAGPTRLVINADVLSNVAGIERVTWEYVPNNPACGDTNRAGQNWCLRRTVVSSAGTTTEIPAKGRGTYPTNTSTCGPNPTDVARQRGISTAAAANGGLALQPLAGVRVFCYQESVPAHERNLPDATGGNRAGSVPSYAFNSWTTTCHSRWITYASAGGQSPNLTLRRSSEASGRIRVQHNLVDAATNFHRLDRITTVSAGILAAGAYGRASERSYEMVSVAIRARENEAYREAIMCGHRAGWGR